MSFAQSGSNPNEGMEGFYESMPSQWTEVESSPYGAVSHPYNQTAAFPSAAILTPISLPDNSYHARPSPVLSHHSQEFPYSVSESIPQHGLGITAPYAGDYTRGVAIGLDNLSRGYGPREDTLSPPPSRTRKVRRNSRQSVAREAPISILPHPEGLQRLEQERRQGQPEPHPNQRPRAPGRGRRDPQAEEEDAFVESLREQNLAWKVIREMFREKFNKDATEARLQMRQLRRRKERLARWDENDVRILMRARHYWEHEKYNLIAQKMKEFGASDSYTAEQCEAQLKHLDSQNRDRGSAPRPRATDPQHTRRRQMLKAARERASITAT